MLVDPRQPFIHVHAQFEILVHYQLFSETVPAVVDAYIGNGKGYTVVVLSGDTVRTNFLGVPILFPDQVIFNTEFVYRLAH